VPPAAGGGGGHASPAEAYDRGVGRYGAQLAAGLIRVAGLGAGQRALDVGCGPGPLTSALAELLGAENVAAVDPSEPFVAACRSRNPGADVRVGVAERLPFADDEFDAVLAQLVVQLMDDRDAGVREIARVARPGGVVAAAVWDSRTMPFLRSFWDAALEVAPEHAGALDDSRRVGYEHPESLVELWEDHGLLEVSTGELLVDADYESFEELWEPFAAGVGHSGATFVALDPERQERVRAGAHSRLGVAHGPFALTARAWWVCGLGPGLAS
jgi:ubiquinone/menaquinone biosynthesis C-methylase UbiE